MSLNRPLWRDHLFGLLLAFGQLLFLWQTAPDLGVPRDESFYFFAGDRAADWVDRLTGRARKCEHDRSCGPGMRCEEGGCTLKSCEGSDPCAPGVSCVEGLCEIDSFSPPEIDRGFKYNHEHPVLMKTLFGVSHRLLSDWGWIDNHLLAYRLPSLILASLSLWLLFLLGVMIHSRPVGLLAALALALMPRVHFHSQLACFDGPVTFMWLLICFSYLKASRSRVWALITGLALGLGFATKLNIFFLPFALLGVAALDLRAWHRRNGSLKAPEEGRGPLIYFIWIALSMIILGGLVFFFHWPWLFYDTWEHLRFYIGFHARHVHYPVDYLGHLYFKPPFPIHFPFLFSALSIPVGILLPAMVGVGVLIRRAWRQLRVDPEDRRGLDLLILVNLFVPLAIIALPNTPIFGGTKHWMPAMPFLAIAFALGLERIARGLWTGRGRRSILLALSLLSLAPALWATLRYGTQGPCYYNALAGGPPGAAELRMPRNFWGHSTIEVLPALNERVEQGGLVFWHKATQWGINAYKRDKLLRQDLRYTGDWTAAYSNWGVYHDQKEKEPEELDIWRAYGTDWPVDGFFLDGVQMMAVYRRPNPPSPPPDPKLPQKAPEPEAPGEDEP